MGSRHVLPKPFFGLINGTYYTPKIGSRVTFYAVSDTERKTPLSTLNVDGSGTPIDVVTTSPFGQTPQFILEGDGLQDTDEEVWAVMGTAASKFVVGMNPSAKVTQTNLTDGLRGKVNVNTYNAKVASLETTINDRPNASSVNQMIDDRLAAVGGGAQPGGEGVSDESVAAVVPTGATAQAIASLVGVVVRDTDAEATTLAGQWGVAGLVIDEVVGGAVEPPADVKVPTITVPAWPSLTVGAAISPLVLSADEPVEWFQSGTLPAGLSFNASTGALSGTPSAAGSGVGVFAATDGAGNAASVEWSWTVSAAPVVRASVVMSERFSDATESQDQLIARSPDNYAGGTVTLPPTAGAFAQTNAGTVATSTEGGMVGVHAVGAGLRLGAQLAAATDAALQYTLPASPRHAEFTVTSPADVTNVVVWLHEAGLGTYAWAQVNTRTLRVGARSGFGTAQSSVGVPFAQGDRVRVEAVLVGADTEVTATNLTTGASTAVTLAGADVTATGRLTIQWPSQYGRGSIDELVAFEGGAA